MPASGFVVVSTQPNRADAELLAGLLRSGGMRVVVEPAQDAEYPSTVSGGFDVTVPADRAGQAAELLSNAEHVDPTDPASSLDVGLPVDDDVRDYLAWRGGDSDRQGAPEPAQMAQPPVAPTSPPTPELHASRLPLLPVLGLVALVVGLLILLR